ncbi:MAG: GHKL domain-containing protein [Lachnospiraceae bacterium]
MDFTRILGIYLDNAIEAAKESKTPKLELHIADFGDRVVLLLSNTFLDHGLTVSEMLQPHTSTKGDGRGIGLSNVSRILEKHPTVFHQTFIKDQIFTQHLELPRDETLGSFIFSS